MPSSDLRPAAPNAADADERRALARGHAVAARASALLALVALTAAAAAVAVAWRQLDPGAATLVWLLCLWWAWLLRRAPGRWRAAGRDQADGAVEEVHGIAAIRLRRGIGLLAPARHELLLAGRRFRIDAAEAERLREGSAVVARVAARSGLLLSVVPAPPRDDRPPASVPMATAVPPAASAGPAVEAPAITLGERDAHLLALIASGLSDKEIARKLGLEPATVRTYNSQLYARLGVRRRTEAVARARALGLLTDVDH